MIVPFKNNEAQLRLCLRKLQAQSLPRTLYEVIAVNNGAESDLGMIAKEFPDVVWIHESRIGSYAARNAGLSQAKGELIAFTDADCLPSPDWLERASRVLLDGRATIVGGRIDLITPMDRPLNEHEIFEERFFGMADHRYLIEKRGFAATANLITYRSVFDRVGLFDADLKSSGDREWVERAVRKGEKLEYAPDAVVAHPRRSTFPQIRKKALRLVGGHISLLRKRKMPVLTVAHDLLRQSIFNPQVHLFAFFCLRDGRRLRFAILVEVMSLIVLIEKLRVLAGGQPRRD